uniref:Uncharacterized protein ycf35 n=1 Tax=Rhodochaete parvula TaxID=110510 RepID=A0A1C9CI84_9RHOD|nr:hypothetical protein Rhodc_040 [Rhodochaete parvula]ARO91338.1 conserved hypothetical plastid protein [Rhodochaete parvula]
MSHFSKIKTTIHDVEMLKSALRDLGLSFNTQTQFLKGNQEQVYEAEIVISQSNKNNFGFSWNGHEYELVVDFQFWCQPWSVDCFLERLMQCYAYNSIVKQGSHHGFEKIKQVTDATGAIQLTFQRWID